MCCVTVHNCVVCGWVSCACERRFKAMLLELNMEQLLQPRHFYLVFPPSMVHCRKCSAYNTMLTLSVVNRPQCPEMCVCTL